MDEILTPENFERSMLPMWRDWEPSGDLLRDIMVETAKRRYLNPDDAKGLRDIKPYGSERINYYDEFLPSIDIQAQAKEAFEKETFQVKAIPGTYKQVPSPEDVSEYIDTLMKEYEYRSEDEEEISDASTDDNDDSFLGPNWTFYNVTRSSDTPRGT